ncbi:NadS family protein [Acinetobacter baumannii]|uniref:NadS family protein n=5 Tax=Bacteria TaxID=2 RepID=UPI0035CEC800
MDNNLFDDLVASIKEAGAIKRKEIKASRVTELELPDIKEVREKTGLTQAEFAARLHISARTLQNWEQGRRYPTGPAATLIRILDAHPTFNLRSLDNKKSRRHVGIFRYGAHRVGLTT